MQRKELIFLIKGFIVLIAFLSLMWANTETFAATYDVTIETNSAFNPATLNINTGDTVRWTASDDGEQVSSDNHPSHTLYPDPACPNASCLDSPVLFTNDTYSFTFEIGGTWEYHNHQKPGKTGTIVVADLNTPAAVSDLATSNAVSTAIDLSWTSPGDDVGSTGNFLTPTTYDIRYSTSTITEGNWASATQVTGEPTPSVAGFSESMTVTGLSSSTTYYFAMKTSDEVPNESALSNVTSLTTLVPSGDTTAPAAITDLALSAAAFTSITLSWTAPGDDGNTGTAQSYDIRYSTSTITEGNWSSATTITGEPIPSVAGSSESMVVSNLTSGTTYYFAIKTSDEEPNISDLSNVPSLATLSTTGTGITVISVGFSHIPPASIIDLDASNATASSVDLTWTASGDDGNTGTANTYDIRYSTSEITDLNWSLATQVTGEPTPSMAGASESMTISELSPDTRYYVAMKTLDRIPNESRLSNLVSFKTTLPADSIAPGAVADLVVSDRTISSIDLVWIAPGDDGNTGTAQSYDMRYSSFPITEENWASATEVKQEPIPSMAGTSESMTLSGLLSDTTYYVAMKTLDKALNESSLSNVVQAGTDIVAPGAVRDVVFSILSPTAVILSWTAPGDDGFSGIASSYDIRFATAPIDGVTWEFARSFINTPIPQEAGRRETMSLLGFDHGANYYIVLRAYDEAFNESALSNMVSFATPASPELFLFERGLIIGVTGEDVTQLQELLAKDSSLYPEGLVTGFFGELTKQAVGRFQIRHGILVAGDPVLGYVGPKTRAKLNELLVQQSITPIGASIETPESLLLQGLQKQIENLFQQIKELQDQLKILQSG